MIIKKVSRFKLKNSLLQSNFASALIDSGYIARKVTESQSFYVDLFEEVEEVEDKKSEEIKLCSDGRPRKPLSFRIEGSKDWMKTRKDNDFENIKYHASELMNMHKSSHAMILINEDRIDFLNGVAGGPIMRIEK